MKVNYNCSTACMEYVPCPKSHPDVGKYTSTMEHMGTRPGLNGLSQRLHMGDRSVRIMVGFYSFFMVLRGTPVMNVWVNHWPRWRGNPFVGVPQ